MGPVEGGYADFLVELGASHLEVVVIDAGLATSMPTEKFAAAYPRRYFNLGVAEQNAVSVASGLARKGFVPLVHTFSNFLARRAHEQVCVSVAWPGCPVKLVGGSCGAYDARNGPSHSAVDDLAAMSSLPGLMVAEPADLDQTRALLFAAVAHPGPAYLRLRRHGMVGSLHPASAREPGTWLVRAAGRPAATLVACGSILPEALSAADRLEATGLTVDLVHAAVLKPLGADPIVQSARRSGIVFTVENHGPTGGFGDAISRVLGPLGVRHHRLSLPDRYLPSGDPGWTLRECRIDAAGIALAVEEGLAVNT